MRKGDEARDREIVHIMRTVQMVYDRLRDPFVIVSEDERLKLKRECSRLESRLESRLQAFINYDGPYADPGTPRSPPSSVADISPRSSLIEPQANQSMDAVLQLGLQPPQQMPSLSHHGAAAGGSNPKEVKFIESLASSTAGVGRRTPRPVLNNVGSAAQSNAQPKDNPIHPTSAPLSVYSQPRFPYEYVRVGPDRVVARPARPVPELHQVRSDLGVYDGTRNMTEGEARAYISGHLRGLNTSIEHLYQSRSAGSIIERPCNVDEEQKELKREWERLYRRGHELLNRQETSSRSFSVYRDGQLSTASTAVEGGYQGVSGSNHDQNSKMSISNPTAKTPHLQRKSANVPLRQSQSTLASEHEKEDDIEHHKRRASTRQPLMQKSAGGGVAASVSSGSQTIRSSTAAALQSQQWDRPVRSKLPREYKQSVQ